MLQSLEINIISITQIWVNFRQSKGQRSLTNQCVPQVLVKFKIEIRRAHRQGIMGSEDERHKPVLATK